MKKYLLGAVALAAFAAPAAAADMAARPYTKAPAPMIAALYDWSGFYIGANGGWGSSRKCWVFGLEAQGNWADLSGRNTSLVFGATDNRSKIEAFGLFTGQIGYAWNNALLYVKGGAAVTDDKYRGVTNAVVLGVPAGTTFDRASETRWGGVVGVGLEYGFSPNWSMAVEYDHLFMGNRNVTMTSTGTFLPVGALSRTDNIGQDVDLVTVRVNYRWGGPVIAKY